MSIVKEEPIKNKKKNKKKEKFKRTKAFFHKIKLIWANRQYRAAIKLSLYFIFIVIVLLIVEVISSQSITKVPVKTSLEVFGDLTSYQYKTTINENNNLFVISGDNTGKEHKFIFNNINYTFKDNKIYIASNNEEVIAPVIDIKIFDLTPSNLEKIIDKAEQISITNYKTGVRETNYNLSVKDFAKIYSNTDIESNDNILISKQEKNNKIVKVTLDLTNYSKITNQLTTIYKIEIDYTKDKEL